MSKELIERMRKAAKCIYLATDKEVADDIADMLNKAASAIQHCMQGGPVTNANPEIAELKQQLNEARSHISNISKIWELSGGWPYLRSDMDYVDKAIKDAMSASPL